MNRYDYVQEQTSEYKMDGVLDYFNERIRIDSYNGSVETVLRRAEQLADTHSLTKCIVKGKREHLLRILARGYMLEAVVPCYFQGHDAYMMVKYKDAKRRNSLYWEEEDCILHNVQSLARTGEKDMPAEFTIRSAGEQDAEALANLFGYVFQIYPAPLHKTDYVLQTMREDTVYYVCETNGTIVSTASAEINRGQGNAELTNCATLPDFRKHGLMKKLLRALENELRSQSIFCSYTIARALSVGMNAAFYQLGYTYTGRMANNCYIFDKMEDMNVWVKDLSS